MSQTAGRYAKALFELAKEQNSLEAVQETLTEIKSLIAHLEDFRQFLNNPLLSYEERCAVLKALFQGKVPDLAFKFLVFITYKNRLRILNEIAESFDALYLVSTNQLRASVTTALPIENEEREFVNQRLREKLQHNILTKWSTDLSLIGGFRIFVQGRIYDYSFKSQLDHFFQHSIQPS